MERLVEVRDAAWPLVVVRIPRALDPPAIESMFKGFDQVLTRKARFATLIDTSALSTFPNALERKTIAEWMAARIAAEALYNLGNAIVITSAPARAVITAINWIRRPVTAQYVVGTPRDGIEWCCERLIQAGIHLTPRIEALRAEERERAG